MYRHIVSDIGSFPTLSPSKQFFCKPTQTTLWGYCKWQSRCILLPSAPGLLSWWRDRLLDLFDLQILLQWYCEETCKWLHMSRRCLGRIGEGVSFAFVALFVFFQVDQWLRCISNWIWSFHLFHLGRSRRYRCSSRGTGWSLAFSSSFRRRWWPKQLLPTQRGHWPPYRECHWYSVLESRQPLIWAWPEYRGRSAPRAKLDNGVRRASQKHTFPQSSSWSY